MRLTTPLARARGHGSAKDGTAHWWAQRLTALGLLPLGICFVIAVIVMTNGTYSEARAAMGHPGVCALWLLFLIALFHHAQLGLQVIIEDYVHSEALKFTSVVAMKFSVLLLGAICIFSVLRAALGS